MLDSPAGASQAALATLIDSLRADIVSACRCRLQETRGSPDRAAAGNPLPSVLLALNQSVSAQLEEAVAAYVGILREDFCQAQAQERQHLARDIHDQVCAGIGVAFRQLELYDMARDASEAAAAQHIDAAQRALIQAMHDLRRVTAGLRATDPCEDLSLGQNLIAYVESLGIAGPQTEVTVSGDESRLAPHIRDQAFLTIREALRNALRHSAARTIRIRIAVHGDELCAAVSDDGGGFDPDVVRTASPGTGIASMKERAAILGGVIRLSSQVGRGTTVELRVPLADSRI